MQSQKGCFCYCSSSLQDQPLADQAREKKFLVFHSSLMKLLQRCQLCGAPDCEVSLSFVGSMVKASITCTTGHSTTWCSQPTLNRKPLGNILLCSAILLTGSSPTKVLRLLTVLGLQTVQKTTYFRFQRCYLLPAVKEVCFSLYTVGRCS